MFRKKSFPFLFSILLFQIFFTDTYAEEDPILITISSDLDKIIFDGKWTSITEWKKSSYNRFNFEDGSKIHLRTAHQDNFIYIQINFESDQVINKKTDSALVCFDTKNDKTIIPQFDDYCFSTTLDGKTSFTYQGNNLPAVNGFFTKIENDKNFVGVGTASDQNDRYNITPHASYEFKIPLDVIGRSNNYGFYFSVFDAYSQNHYSWPHNIEQKSLTSIASPSQWGELISPDKSLPEFNFSLLFIAIFPIMIFTLIFKSNVILKTNIFHY